MRLRKILITVILLVIALFILNSKKSTSAAESHQSQVFKFYGIGSNDTLEQSLQKLKSNSFKCYEAKSTNLDTSGIPLRKFLDGIPENLIKIREMDSRLKLWGTDTKYKDMNIEVLDCETSVPNIFKEVVIYNSGLTNKLLTVYSSFKAYSLVKEKIIKKHGAGLAEDYWQKTNEMMLLYEKFENWHLIIFYEDNITGHYKIIEGEIKEKTIQEKKKLESVF